MIKLKNKIYINEVRRGRDRMVVGSTNTSSNTTQLVSDLRPVCCFFLGTPVPPTNKTERHDITELLLKETLTSITLTVTPNTSMRWATTT